MTRQARTDRGLYWDRAWSLVSGCVPRSPACAHCWSAAEAHIRGGQANEKMQARYGGLTTSDGQWTGKVRLMRQDLEKPLRATQPWTWSVWTDLFFGDDQDRAFCEAHHSPFNPVPCDFVDDAMQVVSQRRDHTFLILTKRARRMRRYFELYSKIPFSDEVLPLPENLWAGVTAENQPCADQRIAELVQIPGHRFLSLEPLLGPVSLTDADWWDWRYTYSYYKAFYPDAHPPVDWVIIGCETGTRRRPTRLAWVREIVVQCQHAGVPVFIKQLDIDGTVTKDMRRWPEDLRLRQYPGSMSL